MSLPIADMEAVGAVVGGCDFTPPKETLIIAPPPAAMQRLQKLHEAAGQLAEHAPEVITSPEAARGLEQALIAAMADCLCTTEGQGPGSGTRLGVSNRTLTTCWLWGLSMPGTGLSRFL